MLEYGLRETSAINARLTHLSRHRSGHESHTGHSSGSICEHWTRTTGVTCAAMFLLLTERMPFAGGGTRSCLVGYRGVATRRLRFGLRRWPSLGLYAKRRVCSENGPRRRRREGEGGEERRCSTGTMHKIGDSASRCTCVETKVKLSGGL